MKNRNLKSILALALSAVLFAAVMAPASFAETPAAAADPVPAADAAAAPAEPARLGRNRRADVDEPENAIGQDAAVAKALAAAGVTAEQAGDVVVHVSENPEGAVVYRVHFTVDGQRYSCEVDALTGETVCQDERDVSDFGFGQGENRRGDGKGLGLGGAQGQPDGARPGSGNDQPGQGQFGQGQFGGGQGVNRSKGGQPRGQRGGLRDGSCADDTASNT